MCWTTCIIYGHFMLELSDITDALDTLNDPWGAEDMPLGSNDYESCTDSHLLALGVFCVFFYLGIFYIYIPKPCMMFELDMHNFYSFWFVIEFLYYVLVFQHRHEDRYVCIWKENVSWDLFSLFYSNVLHFREVCICKSILNHYSGPLN